MSKPKHQHFIPISYLKNFSLEKDEKYFLEAKLKSESEPKGRLLSIRDICVEKNLYTIPHIEGDDKYALEKYYAENVDGLYPDVYKLLTDSSAEKISKDDRQKIIMTTTSLFFRTPKFLNFNAHRLNVILDHAVRNHTDEVGRVKFKFRDYSFDFQVNDLEQVRSQLLIDNKLRFLQEHLKTWHEFVKFKSSAGITVYRIYEETDLITSDNPVSMYNINGKANVFDPENFIALPLDNKHYLTIFPNSEPALTDRIIRQDRGRTFALTTNKETDESSDDWILGKPDTVKNHLRDQENFNKITEENIKEVRLLREKALDMASLMKIVDGVGTFDHPTVIKRLKELLGKDIHKNAPEMHQLISKLEKDGVKIY